MPFKDVSPVEYIEVSGKKLFRISRVQLEETKKDKVFNQLYLTDIGYFPNEENHHVTRNQPIDEYILLFCVKGSGEVRYLQETYKLKSGQFFVLPAKQPHHYSSYGVWSLYWVHFSGLMAKTWAESLGATKKVLNLADQELIKSSFEILLKKTERGLSLSQLNEIHASLWSLLEMFRRPARRVYLKKTEEQTLSNAIEFMNEHWDKNLSLESISNHCHLSIPYFSMLFKRNMKCSPIEYFIQIKMQKAMLFLSTTSESIQSISERLGYDNPFYFSKRFKLYFGLSPRDYRKQCPS